MLVDTYFIVSYLIQAELRGRGVDTEKLWTKHRVLTTTRLRPPKPPAMSADGGEGPSARLDPPTAVTRPTALVWLQSTLRVRDNAIIERAAEMGPGGLAVVVVWRRAQRSTGVCLYLGLSIDS